MCHCFLDNCSRSNSSFSEDSYILQKENLVLQFVHSELLEDISAHCGCRTIGSYFNRPHVHITIELSLLAAKSSHKQQDLVRGSGLNAVSRALQPRYYVNVLICPNNYEGKDADAGHQFPPDTQTNGA